MSAAPPSLDEQAKELRREIVQRKRVFPRWVADGRLKQHDADHRTACLEATLAMVESEIAKGRLL